MTKGLGVYSLFTQYPPETSSNLLSAVKRSSDQSFTP